MKSGFQDELYIVYLGYHGEPKFWKRPWWELYRSLIYFDGNEVIKVPSGFICDLASVPRLPFAYLLFGGTANRAAVLHDYMYREGFDRKESDLVFKDAIILSGYQKLHAQTMYLAVRSFGGFAYKPRPGVLDGRLR